MIKSTLSELQAELVSAGRRRAVDLPVRLGFAALVALVLHALLGWSYGWIWAGAYAALHGADRAAVAWSSGRSASVLTLAALVSTQFGASASFSALALPLWMEASPVSVLLACVLCASAVMNVMVVHQGSRLAFGVSALPHLLWPLAAAALAFDRLEGWREAGAIGLAVLMMAGNAVGAWLISERALRSERQAREALERRRAEAEAATAAKSAFVATVSHELRTPLSGLSAAACELQRRSADPEQMECAAIVADSAAFMQALLSDLLDMAKIEAGRMTVEAVDFDLGRLLHDIGRFWTLEADKRGVTLQMEAAFGLPARVTGDPTRLRQVLNNLFSNAFKFTGAAGVFWSVDAAAAPSGRWVLTIRVSDTGPGLTPEAIGRLFQPFQQADTSIARTHGGTGLGLAISRELARLMGGRLSVESEPGEGATFVLEVSLAAAAPVAAPTPATIGPEPATAPPMTAPGLRMLIADDHSINRRTLTLLLEPLGVTVVQAENGREALKRAGAERFDLILLDVLMPELDGLAAVRRLRAEQGPNRFTPVLAVTGGDAPEQLAACLEAGMTAWVAKPLTAKALYDALDACLSAEADAPVLLSA